jgi:hypothetical protein
MEKNMSEALERALREVAETTREIAYEDANEPYTRDLREASELIRVLGRLMAGKSVHEAFGAPGDWGYGTPIGDALLEVYKANHGTDKLANRT